MSLIDACIKVKWVLVSIENECNFLHFFFHPLSSDPILTAFQLSDELKKLKLMESQFCHEFSELRQQVQNFATSLLDHARTSYELEIMLNYDIRGKIFNIQWPNSKESYNLFYVFLM